jgi:hypothetical protein
VDQPKRLDLAMTSPAETIARKIANALIPYADPSQGAIAAGTLLGAATSRGILDRFKTEQGGLWVGGAVTLTAEALSFVPNAVNAKAHAGDVSWRVALDSIDSVEHRFGYVTRIIDVRRKDGSVVTFRCFGARAFAEQIEAVVKRGG